MLEVFCHFAVQLIPEAGLFNPRLGFEDGFFVAR
jgi:hypothetical protein